MSRSQQSIAAVPIAGYQRIVITPIFAVFTQILANLKNRVEDMELHLPPKCDLKHDSVVILASGQL